MKGSVRIDGKTLHTCTSRLHRHRGITSRPSIRESTPLSPTAPSPAQPASSTPTIPPIPLLVSSLPGLSPAQAPPTSTSLPTPPLPSQPAEPAPAWAGYADLLTVSLLWGTYNPIMRTLYNEPDPLDAATLTALRTTISATGMFTASAISAAMNGSSSSSTTSSTPESAAAAADWWSQALDTKRFTPSTGLPETRLSGLLTGTFMGVIPAGMELGVLNFVGTALQAQGLTHASATRAGFLVVSAASPFQH